MVSDKLIFASKFILNSQRKREGFQSSIGTRKQIIRMQLTPLKSAGKHHQKKAVIAVLVHSEDRETRTPGWQE